MIIQINEDWRIASDPSQWVLQKRNPGAKHERSAWRNLGYFRRVDTAVIECCRRRVLAVEGSHGPDALTPLTSALSTIQQEARQALAGFRAVAAAYHEPVAEADGRAVQ